MTALLSFCFFVLLLLCLFLQATCFFVILLLCLFYKQFVSLSSCYSVFFTSNLFLCPLVTLSFLQAICFFVLLLLCLFYVQFISLSFCYSVFFTNNLSTRSLVNTSTWYPIVKNIKYCICNNEYLKEYVYICCRLYEVNDSLLIGPKNKT